MTLPLGLLSIDVVNSLNQPVSEASIKLTVADPAAANAACNGAVYTMPSTGADGGTREAVINETYTITSVTVGSTVYNFPGSTMTVASGTTTYSPSSSATATVQFAPSAQVVTLP